MSHLNSADAILVRRRVPSGAIAQYYDTRAPEAERVEGRLSVSPIIFAT